MARPRPLRIIHVTVTPTGAPWMVALMREQKRLGHDVAAIIPSLDGGIAAELHAAGIPSYAADVDVLYSLPFLTQKIAALLRLARLFRRLRPDVVHSHIVNAVVTARLASWIADVPMHLAGNVHPNSLETEVVRTIEIGTAFCDAATIASCSYTRELMLQFGVPANQIELIFYAVDQSGHDPALADGARVRRELGIADDTPVIGKIAYFYPPARTSALVPPRLQGRALKGHDVLIRAVPEVLKSFPNAKFVLVGRGWGPRGPEYESELKALAASIDPTGAVLFPGERTDVPDVLAAFDLSVHCSLSDNLAGTVESLLMAKPLVVSDIPGFADTVLHEETGLVVPVDDPAALAAAIVRLLRDRELGGRLGANGRARMLERFTLAKTAADVEALLDARRRVAEDHYRILVSLARSATLPFRLLPMFLEIYRSLRSRGFSLPLFAWHRFRHAVGRARAFARKRITPSGQV